MTGAGMVVDRVLADDLGGHLGHEAATSGSFDVTG